MSHAAAAPSKMAQIVRCPGSISLCANIAGTDNPAAAAGRRSHDIAAKLLTGASLTPAESKGGEFDYALAYAKWVTELAAGAALTVEQQVRVSAVHPSDCWGTPDVYFWVGYTLHVVDYKYGWGIVEPELNWQLICYAAGIIPPGKDMYCKIKVHIYQPRPWHPLGPARTWDIGPATNLRGYINRANSAVAEALSDSPRAATGAHCKYCRARHACSTLWQASSSVVKMATSATPLDISERGLSTELSMLREVADLVNHRLTGVESQITALLKSGKTVPGWAVGASSPGRKVWKSPPGDIKVLGSLMGVDLAKKDALITPAQAIKAGMPKDVVNKFITQNAASLKLIPATDTLAAKAFKKEN